MIQPAMAGSLRSALTALDVPLGDLWVAYVGLGGDLPLARIDSFLRGQCPLVTGDYDRLAQAVNEQLMDQGDNHQVPYAEELTASDRD